MKKKMIAFVLCLVCLVSVVSFAGAEEVQKDYLAGISGTYVELFPEMAKEEYRQLWLDAAAPLVGEEYAEDATDLLLSMCMAEIYGDEATQAYENDPESMRFDCYFLGGVAQFVMDGDVITGLDAEGNEVFSHSYHTIDVDCDEDFLFYQTDDADAGQFTYFAFSPDTMETTYHLEFRYAEDVEDLMSWFEGSYAYWNAAGIAADYTDEIMADVISLFVTENLSDEEA